MPDTFQVLLTRSIFMRGKKADPSAEAGAGAASAPQETRYVLRGISQEDTRFTAFVEDTEAKNTLHLRVGDAIAAGRVRSISLHTVTYDNGRAAQIAVNHDFRGELAPTTGVAMISPASVTIPAQPVAQAVAEEAPAAKTAQASAPADHPSMHASAKVRRVKKN